MVILPGDNPRHRVGLIGAGIGPSLSPALHEREAQHLGLQLRLRAPGHHHAGPGARGGRRPAARDPAPGLQRREHHPPVQAGGGGRAHPALHRRRRARRRQHRGLRPPRRGRAQHRRQGFQESFVRGLPDGRRGAWSCSAPAARARRWRTACSRSAPRSWSSATPSPIARDALADSLRERHGPGRAAVIAPTPRRRRCARADGLDQRHPDRHARQPGLAAGARPAARALWVAEVVYRPLETELLTARAAARLPHAGRRRHGRVPGGAVASSCSPAVRPDRERMLRHFATLAEDDTAVATEPERR